jgi:hypothetical protein
MNKSELVQKVVEAGIVPEADAVKLTKKMLTELLKTDVEPIAEESEVVVEEPIIEKVEPIAKVVVEEPVVKKVEPIITAKKVLRKQNKFKVILKNELPLVRISTRMYDALVKGIVHKNIKELEIIFETYGEFVVQDVDHVKKKSLVSFTNGKIRLK